MAEDASDFADVNVLTGTVARDVNGVSLRMLELILNNGLFCLVNMPKYTCKQLSINMFGTSF